jgi:hypothetical protein
MSPSSDILRRPMASARLRLADGDMRIEAPIQVPSDPVPSTEVLPAVRRLQDALVDAAQQRAARAGRAISCARGCAACCRQPVALVDVEAGHWPPWSSDCPSRDAALCAPVLPIACVASTRPA